MSEGYPSDWGSRRKEVYRRDDFTCQNCGAVGGPRGDAELHAHHIVPKSKGGTHNTSNLKTLCKDCHDAIHGNSVAPTADSARPSETSSQAQLQFPLNESRFPYSVADEISCGNQIANTYELVNGVIEAIEELNELFETAQSLPADKESDRLSRKIDETVTELDDHLQSLYSELSTFDEEISWTDSKSTISRYNDFQKAGVELQVVVEEYRATLENLSAGPKDEDLRATLVDLKLLADDLDAALEDYTEKSEALINRLYGEIASELDRIDSNTTSITPITPDSCPVCTGETTVIRRSIEVTNHSYTLLRCTECDTEWTIDLQNLTVSSGPEGLVGVSMAPTVWKRGANKGFSLPEDLDEFNKLSEIYEREKKRLLGAVAIGQVGILIGSYVLGSVLLWVIGTVLLVSAARGLFTWRLDRVLGGSSSFLSGLLK
ncbi:HNH endonuclease [Haloarcula brevis]|uniref:HNH endonuclease n=1 Tax=Haloarcula brevis TaxID=3111453 RepID=UPI00300EE274